MTGWFEVMRTLGILVGALGALVFVVYYHLTAKWYRNPMGVFLMLGGLGWLSLYLAGVASILFPNELVQNIIRAFLIIGAGSFAWYQVFLYRRVRKQERERRRNAEL